MTQGASAFPEADDLPDVARKWIVPLKPDGDFMMWEFRKEPFASEEEFRLKLAVMGLKLGEERAELRGIYSRVYRVLPEGPGVSGEREAGGG